VSKCLSWPFISKSFLLIDWARRGRDLMGVGFITTYAIGAYHHLG